VLRDAPVEEDGYIADEVDAVSGAPDAVGLIYPAISLADDTALAIVAGIETWNDPGKRAEFGAKYDMISNVQDGDAPAFLCACMDDDVLPPLRLAELAKAYDDHGVQTELHIFPYGGHGFGACVPHVKGPFPPADYSACNQWLSLFSNWINRVFE
jgi:acetyl esterase/lipase